MLGRPAIPRTERAVPSTRTSLGMSYIRAYAHPTGGFPPRQVVEVERTQARANSSHFPPDIAIAAPASGCGSSSSLARCSAWIASVRRCSCFWWGFLTICQEMSNPPPQVGQACGSRFTRGRACPKSDAGAFRPSNPYRFCLGDHDSLIAGSLPIDKTSTICGSFRGLAILFREGPRSATSPYSPRPMRPGAAAAGRPDTEARHNGKYSTRFAKSSGFPA